MKIERELSPDEAVELVAFLRANIFVFPWTPAHMPGIPEEVAIHQLNLNPEYPPVQQKARSFGPIKETAMKEEVSRFLTINIIREMQFATWLANVVMVPKPNQKWRMCVDFANLNKACPKDYYPLCCIDVLIDATSGFKFFSFLGAFAGYHQIKLAKEDQIQTSFRVVGGI